VPSGVEDVLFIRGAGGGEALWLAWSPDGSRLAFATKRAKRVSSSSRRGCFGNEHG
jgi:WD40-like Beta Propeller Repeat